MENNNGIGGLGRQSFERSTSHHYTAHKNLSYMFDTLLHANQTMGIGANISNNTLPADMTFGAAQIIRISAYTPLFFISAFLNLRVLRKLWRTKQIGGLSRLNQLLMHLVLADLFVSSLELLFRCLSRQINLKVIMIEIDSLFHQFFRNNLFGSIHI